MKIRRTRLLPGASPGLVASGWLHIEISAHKKGRSIKVMEHKQTIAEGHNIRIAGGEPLTVELVQRVYENSIKLFGSLTCYLCYEHIVFGKDNLEYKIPLSRGGMNEYANLGVACCSCHYKKGEQTEMEYRKCLA